MRWVLLVLAAGCQFDPDWAVGGPPGGGPHDPGGVPPGGSLGGDDAGAVQEPPIDAMVAGMDAEEEDELSTTLPIVTWAGKDWAVARQTATTTYPMFAGEDVILTPNVGDRASAIFPVLAVRPPFRVTLEYRTYDNDGCAVGAGFNCQYNSADGWEFMYGKDIHAYETTAPPSGNKRSFIADDTGMGVHFELYGTRVISLRDGMLQRVTYRSAETYSEMWRKVKIEVGVDTIDVYRDDAMMPTLSWHAASAWDATYPWIGFGAGTGGAAAEHRLRKIAITLL